MKAVPTCYHGSPEPLPQRRPLRAGPLTVEYENGDLRYLRLGQREVIRRWYVAVRDRNWGTVPARLAAESFEVGADHFRITYRVENRQDEIDFAWTGSIVGSAEGTITFGMEGLAHSTFASNRIGFCLLHPIRECAGARCRFELEDGSHGEGTFPRFISPDNPFRDLRAFRHEVSPGLWAELRFEGDLFEMEDQRNWTDASFKTFCTPLRIPFPVTVSTGSRVCQSVTLRLQGTVPAVPADRSPPILEIRTSARPTLPRIGLCVAGHGSALTGGEVETLRLLRPAHLRVELDLTAGDVAEHLQRAAAEAELLGAAVEAAVTVSDAVDEEMARLLPLLQASKPALCRVLLFHKHAWSTPERILAPASAALGRYDASVPLYAGTTFNFAELNRNRPPLGQIQGVCFSAQPQEHAFDNASLIEAMATLADTLESARQFCGDVPLAVTPITLRKRSNPYATGPTPPVPPGQLPPQVDPRQMSLFGAAWTLGSLKYLAENEAASLTYHETTGWLGVLEREQGCPLPDRFPSTPGMVFPLFHVLADAAAFAGAEVVPLASSQPLVLDGLMLRKKGAFRHLLANLTDQPLDLRLGGLPREVFVRVLDEDSFEQATGAGARAFHEGPGEPRLTERSLSQGGILTLGLQPYAYVRIDCS